MARQHGAAQAVGNQIENGGKAVDFERDARAQAELGQFHFHVHAQCVGAGGDEQRQLGQFGQGQRFRVRGKVR